MNPIQPPLKPLKFGSFHAAPSGWNLWEAALISVIIPAHNGAAYLAEAIQSVLNQTYPHFEIWVIDNGSKDQTAQIAKSFPEVHYVYSRVANTALARNKGILLARGSLLAFLDQDDVWQPDKLAKQLAYLEKNPSLSAVICQQQMVLQEGCSKPHWLKKEFLQTTQIAYLPSALLVKRVAFEQTDLFDPTLSLSSDTDWFFKAKNRGVEIGLYPEVLLLRRIHNDNASNECTQNQKELLSIIQNSLSEKRTKVSVIISVWNGENYIKEAIESALSQDYPNKEIIVVNDGSTDSTQKIIDSFGLKVRCLYQSNQGPGAGRNNGIAMARGNYLAFLDHDDFWDKTKLTMQMAKMDATDPLIFSHVKQFICPSLNAEESSKLNVDETPFPSHFSGNLLISKKRFLQIGPFFEKKIVGEFIDWYARALEAKVPMVMHPQVMLYRRIHNHNMGRQKELYDRKEYLKILKNSLERRRSRATSS